MKLGELLPCIDKRQMIRIYENGYGGYLCDTRSTASFLEQYADYHVKNISVDVRCDELKLLCIGIKKDPDKIEQCTE